MNRTTAALVRRTAIAFAVTLSATLAAAPALQAQTISACYSKGSGTLYRVGVAGVPAGCTSGNHGLETWNVQGPAGPQGPKGDPGTFALPFSSTSSSASTLFTLTQTGSGGGAQFLASGGTGVLGRSISGAGVHGIAPVNLPNAAGVRAENGTNAGTALEITRGGIRVAGAGVGTPTAAFRLVGKVGALSEDLMIDNPLTNNNPNAMLFVTHVQAGTCKTQKGDFFTRYVIETGRWGIFYMHPNDGCKPQYQSVFHVLVIKP